MKSPMHRCLVVILTVVVLLGLGGGAAWAHKEKLPADALTLVRQASALLAQNPGMTGEVKERLEAALKSRKPQGVDLKQVAAALAALDKRDVATARRLLLTSIMPAGMPMPPQAPGRAAPQAAGPPPPRATVPASPPAAAESAPMGAQLSVEAAMTMAAPLQVRFAGSRAETSVLIMGLGFVGLGLFLLGRSRRALWA